MAAARFIVRGRVQGVYYRASTRDHAIALGLVGSARNLDDGSVEVTAVGTGNALAELERWLWQGPPAASVAEVRREELNGASSFREFVTG
ncbi:MAG: acylphosphatase [Xanthomonadales bacterium]|nr:acylphosphatase [Xanthomonadales bacterium]MBK7145350.1 acylphosphatase [Xanthomonadales bacterium]MCC6560963.1 acylphosphatase [Xanthomonadales bacterium]